VGNPESRRGTVRAVDRKPPDPWREIHERGDADLALAFGHLFWPVFVERRGCVLIEHRADDTAVARCIKDCDGDLQRVEATLNRVQIRNEMFTEDSPREDEVLMDVARLMERTWKAAVAEQFPGREFWIELVDADDEWGGPTLYLMRGPRPEPDA
jgi:hypothetical protein